MSETNPEYETVEDNAGIKRYKSSSSVDNYFVYFH